MFRLKVKFNESGRSMVEMLTVLVIMGLLTAIMVPMIRRAVAKSKANEIVHDGRIIQMESVARMGEIAPGWQAPQYKSQTGKDFQMMRDIKGQNYVKVSGVEKDVCGYMLNLQRHEELVFLTEPDYTAFTECVEGENTIVMSFEGVAIPAECASEKNCQDKYGEESGRYCDGSGRCIACDPEVSEVTWEGDGCQCKEGINGQSCQDDQGHTWCCGRMFDCGAGVNECNERDIECEMATDCEEKGKTNHYCADGQCVECGGLTMLNEAKTACVCDLTQSVSCTDENNNSWCCGNGLVCDITQPNGCKTGEGLCEYELTTQSQTSFANCSYNFSITNGVSSIQKVQGCPLGDYCALRYTDSTCNSSSVAAADYTGQLYGVCLRRTVMGSAACNAIGNGVTWRQIQGCSVGQYCALNWADENCVTASNDILGSIYGVCVSRTTRSSNAQCPVTQQ